MSERDPPAPPAAPAAPTSQRLRSLLRAARARPEDPEAWRRLSSLAARAGDHGLARYALEAGLEAAGADFAEAARASAGLGLAPQDPNRTLPIFWEAWWSLESVLQPAPPAPPPRVSPDGRWVAFSGAATIYLYELSTLACVARVVLGHTQFPIAWSSPRHLVFSWTERPRCYRLIEAEVTRWPEGLECQTLEDLPGVVEEAAPSFEGDPAAALPDCRMLLRVGVEDPELALATRGGRTWIFENPTSSVEERLTLRALAGPDHQLLIAHLGRHREYGGEGTTLLQVVEAPPDAPAGPTDRLASRVAASYPVLVEPVAWDEAGWVGVRVVDGDTQRLEAVGAPAPGARDAWAVPLDGALGERTTGVTPEGGLMISGPGRFRVIDRATGVMTGRGRLPEGCVGYPLDDQRVLAVRPGRFEVVGRRSRRRSAAPRDDAGAIVALAATPTRLLQVHRRGKVRWMDLESGEVLAERQGTPFLEDPRDGPELPVQVGFDHAQRRALVPTARGLAVLELADLSVVAERHCGFSPSTASTRITAAALAPCGDVLLLGDANGRLRRLRLPDLVELPMLRLGDPNQVIDLVVPHPGGDRAAVLSRQACKTWEVGLEAGAVHEEWALGMAIEYPRAWLLAPIEGGYLAFGATSGALRLDRGRPHAQALRTLERRGPNPVALDPATDHVVLNLGPGGAQTLLQVARFSDGAPVATHRCAWPSMTPERCSLPPGAELLVFADGEVAARAPVVRDPHLDPHLAWTPA